MKKVNILIVEDSMTQAEQLKHTLESNQFKTQIATSGEEALKLLTSIIPEIIITDIIMPGMDGFELCRNLKVNPETESIPIILLTTLSSTEDVVMGLASGADNFITKPYDEYYLLHIINACLKGKDIKENKDESIYKISSAGLSFNFVSNHKRILNFLLSSYEVAIQRNKSLEQSRNKIMELNNSLEKKVIDRTQRILQINNILLAIRNINQLIIKERNREVLVEEACNILVSTKGFETAWILLFDDQNSIDGYHEATLLEGEKRIKTNGTVNKNSYCVQKALSFNEVFVIEDVEKACVDCTRSAKFSVSSLGTMFMGLWSGGRCYGVINVTIKKQYLQSEELQSLFKEVVEDIAYALHNLEVEKKRRQSDEELSVRNRISEVFLTFPHEEMYEEVLKIILKVMESKYGFFGYINEDGALVCPSMTKDIWDECKMIEKDIVFPRESWGGIWGKAMVEKKALYSNKPFKVPKGHIPVGRALDVPIIHQGDTIGNLLVGNKKTDYNDGDMGLLQIIADHIAPVLHARLQREQEEINRLKAEEEKLEKEEHLETLRNNVPLALYRTTVAGRLIYANPAMVEMLGYDTPEEMIKKPITTFFRRQEERQTLLNILFKGGVVKNYEIELIKRNGTIFWGAFSIRAIFDRNNKHIFNDGIISDITELKKTTIELITAKDKAEESDRLKTSFLQNMSHEIRTPMNCILGFTNLLKEHGLTSKQQQKYIDIIDIGGMRLLNTINDIMDISMIESGQVKMSISEININKQIEDLYNLFKPEVEKKGIQLTFHNYLPNHKANIQTDQLKFLAIFSNIIKNSIKFTHEGSIKFGYTKKGDELEFFVNDTGIGIPENRQLAIFERFVQADIKDVNVHEGSGLGLSISKAFVNMLNGSIWVVSEQGKGSKFCFTIPFKRKTENETTVAKKTSELVVENNILRLKILIAEDEETADTYLSIVVKSISKEILHAKTGTEAVELCRNNQDIDLILMDIRMPDMNGYEASRKIREFNKDVIIVAQTAYALTGDREKAIGAGCDDHISKPIDVCSLMGMIEKHLL